MKKKSRNKFKTFIVSFIISFIIVAAIVLGLERYTYYLYKDFSISCRLGDTDITWFGTKDLALDSVKQVVAGNQILSYGDNSKIEMIEFEFTGQTSGRTLSGSVNWLNYTQSTELEKGSSCFNLDTSKFQNGEVVLLKATFKNFLIGKTVRYYAFKVSQKSIVLTPIKENQEELSKTISFYFDGKLVREGSFTVNSLQNVQVTIQNPPEKANMANIDVYVNEGGKWVDKYGFMLSPENSWAKSIDFTKFIGDGKEVKLSFGINTKEVASYYLTIS